MQSYQLIGRGWVGVAQTNLNIHALIMTIFCNSSLVNKSCYTVVIAWARVHYTMYDVNERTRAVGPRVIN